MEYLQSEQYYSDLYDLLTIKKCLDYKDYLEKNETTEYKPKRGRTIRMTMDLLTYYIKGHRYVNKAETISQWMQADREKDEKVENSPTPKGIFCSFCLKEMPLTMKHLYHDEKRIMFWFECPNCNKRKAIFDNGQRYLLQPHLCPKCNSELKETIKRRGEVITTTITCPKCSYKAKELMDLEKDSREWAEKQKQDQVLLEKYRSLYCLTDKEGQDYIYSIENMKRMNALIKETEAKQKDPAYQKAKNLKKIGVAELEKKLNQILVKEKYLKLSFGKPELDKFVIIPFTVQESDLKRKEYDSQNILKKLIIKSLKETNWRLMSEGVNYRLGYLSGRLKGYEREDDLVKIIKEEKT